MQTCMSRVPDSSSSAIVPRQNPRMPWDVAASTACKHASTFLAVCNKHAAKHSATLRNIIIVQNGRHVCRLAARSRRFGLVAVVVSTAGYEGPMSKLATDRGGCKRKSRMRGRDIHYSIREGLVRSM
jgi:hypothetical protein